MVGNGRRFVRVVGLALGVLGGGSVLLGVVSSPAVAATGMWSTPFDLSLSGGDAYVPQISVNSAGTAIAVWGRYDGSNYFIQSSSSTDGGVTWSTPARLSAAGGNAGNPQISVNAAGAAIAVWNRFNGSNDIVQSASSTDGGLNWSTPDNLSAIGGSATQPQISMNSAGTAIAVWGRYDGSSYFVQSVSSTDGGATWSPTVNDLSAAGGDAFDPQISVNSAGTAIAIWRRNNGSNSIVQSASSTDGGVNWSTPANNLSAIGGNAVEPQISVDAAGTAIAIWRRYDGSDFIVQSASSTNGGVTWSTPANSLSLTGASAVEPQISVDAAGTAIAIWIRFNGSNNIVQSVSSTDGGATWSPTVNDLSAAGGDASGPQISVDAAGTAIAIWSRDNGSDSIVQSVSSADGGVTWSTPAINVSAAGGSANNPQFSMNAAGTAIAVWYRYDGSNYFAQTSSLTLPSLANTGATSGAATTTLGVGVGVGVGVGAGLLTAGVLALLLRRRLASD